MDSKAVAVILLLAGGVSATTGNINMVVGENGNAFTIIVLEGAGTVRIPMPLDVSDPVVKGGLYIQSPEGIEVSLTRGDVATIAYKTTLLTSKQGDSWTLEAVLPTLEGSSVMLSLPANAVIRESAPKASIMEANDSKNLMWDNAKAINVSYSYPKDVSTTLPTQATPTTLKKEGGSIVWGAAGLFAVAAAVLLALAAAAYGLMRMGRKRLTEGMANVMKTMSGNEYKVVDTLLKNGGGMRRSDLERASGISKSSLAVALNNLERKGVAEVNRDNTTHYVGLTEWFKRL